MDGRAQPAEVVVIGGGAMGCAIAWALARRGVKVQVIEGATHVHERGSHGGFTRVIRHAYHEGEGYVRLVDEADRQWDALGQRRGRELLARRGLLEFGPLDDPDYASALHSLEVHKVPHERLSPAQADARWGVKMPAAWDVSLTPQSGFLRVGACMDALREEARHAGAKFSYGTKVVRIERERGRPDQALTLRLDNGEGLESARVVVAAGAYTQCLLPGLARLRARGELKSLRRVLAWTQPAAEHRQRSAAVPVWAAFTPTGFFYGFPFGNEGIEGFKLAVHVSGPNEDKQAQVDPDKVGWQVGAQELAPMQDFLARYMPFAQGPVTQAKVCLYGQSCDGDFVIDLHPEDPRICVCAGFSGHGFKFAPTIGMLVADLMHEGRSQWQLERFSL